MRSPEEIDRIIDEWRRAIKAGELKAELVDAIIEEWRRVDQLPGSKIELSSA
jgi:hypothetical protein